MMPEQNLNSIRIGMKIRLRHLDTGALLSALERGFYHEGSSHQNMVGGTAKRDQSSIWLVKPSHNQRGAGMNGKEILHGDAIRLEHVATRRNLHSHNNPAPLTGKTGQREVTTFVHLAPGEGNTMDDWVVLPEKVGPWLFGESFRLRHETANGRFLHSHGIADPNYTAGLFEVTALDSGDFRDLYVCERADQPEFDDLPRQALEIAGDSDASGIKGNWIHHTIERFKKWGLVAILLFSCGLVFSAWEIFANTILATTKAQLSLVQEDRDRLLREKNARGRSADVSATAKPRLSDEQVEGLAKVWSSGPRAKVMVTYHRGDPAGDGLAGDIARALGKAGTEVTAAYFEEYTPERGIIVRIRSAAYRADLVKALQDGLKSVGIDSDVKVDPKLASQPYDANIDITN